MECKEILFQRTSLDREIQRRRRVSETIHRKTLFTRRLHSFNCVIRNSSSDRGSIATMIHVALILILTFTASAQQGEFITDFSHLKAFVHDIILSYHFVMYVFLL